MNKQKILKWVVLGIALAINIFILVNALINGEVSAQESNSVAHSTAEVVNAVKPETITPKNFDRFAFDLRKAVGHFGLFALSGSFSTWSFYLFLKDCKIGFFPFQLVFTFSFGFLMAVGSEFAQNFVPGRNGNWLDVLIDFSGYFLGISLLFLIFLCRKSKIFYKKNY